MTADPTLGQIAALLREAADDVIDSVTCWHYDHLRSRVQDSTCENCRRIARRDRMRAFAKAIVGKVAQAFQCDECGDITRGGIHGSTQRHTKNVTYHPLYAFPAPKGADDA